MVAARYGYREMVTPIFEFTEVFKRTLGDTSDVVTKEMYTFADQGRRGDHPAAGGDRRRGARLHLRRPDAEPAAQGLLAGPMFRHERPQKGRQRQFHQIDIELLGVPRAPGRRRDHRRRRAILDALGVRDKTTLELNTLGDPESRKAYREALVAYFRPSRQPLRGQPRPADPQPPAHPRFQGQGRRGPWSPTRRSSPTT